MRPIFTHVYAMFSRKACYARGADKPTGGAGRARAWHTATGRGRSQGCQADKLELLVCSWRTRSVASQCSGVVYRRRQRQRWWATRRPLVLVKWYPTRRAARRASRRRRRAARRRRRASRRANRPIVQLALRCKVAAEAHSGFTTPYRHRRRSFTAARVSCRRWTSPTTAARRLVRAWRHK